LTGLSAGTTYFARAYATNSVGTAYGNEMNFKTSSAFPGCGTVTDADENIYNTVTIGSQCWMQENLKTTRYRNGDLIGTTTPAILDISSETNPEYQWAYNGNESNVATYGRLYTWYTVTDSRNVCPEGWHVPTDAEWTTLTDFLTNNGYGYDGSGDEIAKSMATISGWTTDPTAGNVGNNQAGNNSSGFSALPGGSRFTSGAFLTIGAAGIWWSATEGSATLAWCRYMIYRTSIVTRDHNVKSYDFSVRCLRDN
jgi:uncharacterized protein (TIGR02145 family)